MKCGAWPSLRAHVSIGAFCYRTGIIFHLSFVGRQPFKFKPTCVPLACVALACLFATFSYAQQNPVERKVENPITDTPNVNPLQQDQPVRLPSSGKLPTIQPGDVLEVTA